ncbi:MAG: SPOR domain-containing protein [Sphingobium sp.]
MGDYARGELDFDEEDRLPWLEPGVDEAEDERISPLRLLGLILAGLVLIGIIVGGIWWLQNRNGGAFGGQGTLIEAPAGDYKVAANEADARKFDGEHDVSFAASEGVSRDGRIDPSRVPEAPITGTRPAAAKPPVPGAKPAQSVRSPVADGTGEKAAGPAPVTQPRASGTIQLGAYGSQATAQDAWKKLAKRFAYLAPLGMSVESAQVGGSTVYRLRAAAGGEAATICGRLKVAGENCMVVN